MSKRVANTRERTARNGRVRYGWARKRNIERARSQKSAPLDTKVHKETPKPPTFMDKVRRVFRHQKRGS